LIFAGFVFGQTIGGGGGWGGENKSCHFDTGGRGGGHFFRGEVGDLQVQGGEKGGV